MQLGSKFIHIQFFLIFVYNCNITVCKPTCSNQVHLLLLDKKPSISGDISQPQTVCHCAKWSSSCVYLQCTPYVLAPILTHTYQRCSCNDANIHIQTLGN